MITSYNRIVDGHHYAVGVPKRQHHRDHMGLCHTVSVGYYVSWTLDCGCPYAGGP